MEEAYGRYNFCQITPIKLFFRCAVPSTVTMVFGALYQIADGLFVGRSIGQDALAAVILVMPIIMMVFAFFNMVPVGLWWVKPETEQGKHVIIRGKAVYSEYGI